ncbi:uncharacterized protein LOC132556747 [Ylistrum balloti]|uniref:uncharacterized protein LOC132556747 n=1 Tax=Ylistrum balloti TaxID=509963 RepID=UPI0029059C4F|nr:uncharacterized protein LOC132556747 [Ylistrum balloti]
MERLLYIFATGLSLSLIYGLCNADEAAPSGETFWCHVCSYTVNEQANGFDCLNNTGEMNDLQSRIKCGNYCVIQEQWDKGKKEINSVFRSCSTNWGNQCYDDNTYITCRGSCKGEYCNNSTVTEKNRFDDLCDELSCEKSGSLSNRVTIVPGVIWLLIFVYI